MSRVIIAVESPAGDVQVDVSGPDTTILCELQTQGLGELLDDAVTRVRAAYGITPPQLEEADRG